jgi:hypothetical protein
MELNSGTTDENCRSIQAILSPVVCSGYYYATYIHNIKSKQMKTPPKAFHWQVAEYDQDLTELFRFTEWVFEEINEEDSGKADLSVTRRTFWGKVFDIEQMIEHAIVHVLRHR